MNTKPPASNRRIARQKKAQAAFSLTGGTLGLAALASRGRAAQLGRRGEAGIAAANKFKDRSTALTTAGAGVGGVGAYNFASYTNAEAKKQQKLKKNLDDPFEIHKLGGPKVRLQELTAYTQRGNSTTRHDADEVETHYKGKSLILRRPKYQAVAYPGKVAGKLKAGDHIGATPNLRVRKKPAKALAEAHEKKSKTVELGTYKLKHVSKADTTSAFGINHGY